MDLRPEMGFTYPYTILFIDPFVGIVLILISIYIGLCLIPIFIFAIRTLSPYMVEQVKIDKIGIMKIKKNSI